jgi:hypothetical protein
MSDESHEGNGRPPEEEADERAARAVSDVGLVGTAVGVARITAFAWIRTAQWGARTTARAASLTMRAAMSGMSPTELFRATGADTRDYLLEILGIEREPEREEEVEEKTEEEKRSPLRERGAELLRRSADVHFNEDMHPAYERILGEISPDEGRILRLLAAGPQPSVDVRTSRPLNVGSELISSGLTMIGAEAGCRHSTRVPAYLNNLFRLGLVWFSREPLKDDPRRYQVLEAQPDVLEALKRAGRGRTIRRSVELTPFGKDFCEVTLPMDTVELEALPGEQPPGDDG